jgi:hypothetical protein
MKVTMLKKTDERAYVLDVEVLTVRRICDGGKTSTKIALSELPDDLNWREILNQPRVANHDRACWMYAPLSETVPLSVTEGYCATFVVDTRLETGSGKYQIDDLEAIRILWLLIDTAKGRGDWIDSEQQLAAIFTESEGTA